MLHQSYCLNNKAIKTLHQIRFLWLYWYSQQESNLYLSLRRGLFYPLNYESTLTNIFYYIHLYMSQIRFLWLYWYSQQESNLYLSLRRGLFYPLNYESTLTNIFYYIHLYMSIFSTRLYFTYLSS